MGKFDCFLTTYKHDFDEKPSNFKLYIGFTQQFKDPINESYKDYLTIKESPENEQENIESFLKRFQEQNPQLYKIYCKDGINYEILKRYFYSDGPFRTTYNQYFGNVDKELQLAEEDQQKLATAKAEMVPRPQAPTTYRILFRTPTKIDKNALNVVEAIKPRNNLHVDESIKFTKSKSAKTEYQRTIGKMGDVIMQDGLHRKIIQRR